MQKNYFLIVLACTLMAFHTYSSELSKKGEKKRKRTATSTIMASNKKQKTVKPSTEYGKVVEEKLIGVNHRLYELEKAQEKQEISEKSLQSLMLRLQSSVETTNTTMQSLQKTLENLQTTIENSQFKWSPWSASTTQRQLLQSSVIPVSLIQQPPTQSAAIAKGQRQAQIATQLQNQAITFNKNSTPLSHLPTQPILHHTAIQSPEQKLPQTTPSNTNLPITGQDNQTSKISNNNSENLDYEKEFFSIIELVHNNGSNLITNSKTLLTLKQNENIIRLHSLTDPTNTHSDCLLPQTHTQVRHNVTMFGYRDYELYCRYALCHIFNASSAKQLNNKTMTSLYKVLPETQNKTT
ncbi:MAG TPA: hypothetical protein VEK38_00155 [Candidatus Bathyarchaeia archaeon]|nr:hypothetical protein [Candidatus Bathyarchaeia archaeon]